MGWKGKGPEVWGNVPQWIGAVAALIAAGSTVVGIYIVTPAFQNMRLRENNARLELELEEKQTALLESREKTWDFVCDQFVLRAKTFSGTSFLTMTKIDLSDPSQLGDLLDTKNLRPVGTGQDAINNARRAEEFGLLLKGDRSLFERLVNQLIEQNTDQLSVSLFMPDTEGADEDDIERAFGEAKTAQQKFRTILMAFLKTCKEQNPVNGAAKAPG